MTHANHPAIDPARTRAFVATHFKTTIVPALIEYIRIPNKSPSFDAEWQSNGYMEQAVELLAAWARTHAAPDVQLEIVRLPGRTPLIFMDVPATPGAPPGETVLLYGHLDKQPEMTGWDEGKGPWTPVLAGDKLYGRGGADDGYSIFSSLLAINALHDQGGPHTRCVILIEGCEESGSYDLPAYIEHLQDRIGTPGLVICLDSGCGDYERLWLTTSLRGLVLGQLRIEVLREGVHSGDASGVVPSSFRILRELLDRLEDPRTGAIRVQDLCVEIPQERIEQAGQVAKILGEQTYRHFPFVDDMQPCTAEAAELVLNRTWRPALSVTGMDGLPPIHSAGNVLRPFTAAKLSLRVPPTLDAVKATQQVKEMLESNPPYGARVSFEPREGNSGWNAPPLAPWLAESLSKASREHFGQEAAYQGEGGTIPFMGMLGKSFPEAQFVITGVLGPQSNAHGPNEFLHLPTAERITCCVAEVLARYCSRQR